MSQDINELSQRYCGDEIGLIGATGNLGGRVARELADQGCFVRLIVRQPKKLQNSVHTVVFGDLDSPETCLLYTSPSPRDRTRSRMPSSA